MLGDTKRFRGITESGCLRAFDVHLDESDARDTQFLDDVVQPASWDGDTCLSRNACVCLGASRIRNSGCSSSIGYGALKKGNVSQMIAKTHLREACKARRVRLNGNHLACRSD